MAPSVGCSRVVKVHVLLIELRTGDMVQLALVVLATMVVVVGSLFVVKVVSLVIVIGSVIVTVIVNGLDSQIRGVGDCLFVALRGV